MSSATSKVAVIGSGLIGGSWAMLFAGAGYSVCLYDISEEIVDRGVKSACSRLDSIADFEHMLRGTLTPEQQKALITGTANLEECLKDSVYVQECVPENLDLKKDILSKIDTLVGPSTIIASSTSTFMPSLFSEKLKNRSNVIVAHPVNPPYFVPLVEIVPAPWTDPKVVEKTKAIMIELGQKPVTLTRETPGFALNRIQYVILNECWHLVNDGILSVEDVDSVMSEGLGMRYALLGPLETAHLNAEGMENYCERYSNSMYNVCKTMKPAPKFEGNNVVEMHKQLCARTPVDQLQERRNWRDRFLMELSLLKKVFHKSR